MKIIPYILVIMTIACAAHAATYDIPDDVSLINICFNHTTGSTSDALRLKYDHTTIVPAPEWTATNTESIGYVAGTPADLLIEITRSDFDIDSLKVRLVTDSTSIGTYSDTWFTFSGPPEELDYLRNASGGIPSGVGVNPLKLEWYIVQVNDDQPFQNPVLFALTRHEYYAVLDTPQAPMDSAWVDVLDYACDWAGGETTADSVASKVTHGIYWHLGDTDGDIDYGSGDWDWWNENNDFRLKHFFDSLSNSSEVYVRCPQTAMLECIFARALGIQMIRRYFNIYMKDTLPVELIGGDNNWLSYSWDEHYTGEYVLTDSTFVCDPCFRVCQSDSFLPVNLGRNAYMNYVWGQAVGITSYPLPGVTND